jgi:hypothetical protein
MFTNPKGVKKSMTEKDIENYLRDKVKDLKGKAYKWISPGNNGVPDRIVLFPGGSVAFIELKAPGKKATPLQLVQHKRLENLGFEVFVIDSKQGVDEFIKSYGDGGIE